ncbi:nucleotidyltransferase family protein [Hydrogenimonas thermophila]|uniref:Nucleotidyltransferase domain-containing protein n=1 Tax=Hydrogenimonas thermophila TaxID=223786 RepID=A0A1I5MAN2_9BACT|nr:nucleotidyltransferase domain-containing protein [Hydrogenimonas thermophila]WOE70626.1 nucleotidyltransferase domain-containing protein [Hydrogenimonas thermophila]WOE73144.1 nucleotidyltransferase domain-containing protein [Hydrogenimonas thermophila]SFP06632.1 Nucleotidyltransferase domain-containing protein [Hydrogenimonas thermophila]
MRLEQYELDAIRESFIKNFQKGKVYLFGSRVDENKKGGDIDLYIDLGDNVDLKEVMKMKQDFKLDIYDKIGEQKIDIVISKDKQSSIVQEALKKGILLCEI